MNIFEVYSKQLCFLQVHVQQFCIQHVFFLRRPTSFPINTILTLSVPKSTFSTSEESAKVDYSHHFN